MKKNMNRRAGGQFGAAPLLGVTASIECDASNFNGVIKQLTPECFLNLPLRLRPKALRILKSPAKLCRLKFRSATRTRIVTSLEPSDSLIDLVIASRTEQIRKLLVIKHAVHKCDGVVMPNDQAHLPGDPKP